MQRLFEGVKRIIEMDETLITDSLTAVLTLGSNLLSPTVHAHHLCDQCIQFLCRRKEIKLFYVYMVII